MRSGITQIDCDTRQLSVLAARNIEPASGRCGHFLWINSSISAANGGSLRQTLWVSAGGVMRAIQERRHRFCSLTLGCSCTFNLSLLHNSDWRVAVVCQIVRLTVCWSSSTARPWRRAQLAQRGTAVRSNHRFPRSSCNEPVASESMLGV